MRDQLVDELKLGRKGKGLTPESVERMPTVLQIYDSRFDAYQAIVDYLHGPATNPNRRALIVAYNIDPNEDHPDELTERRRLFSEQTGLTSRSIARHEDDVIDDLADYFAGIIRRDRPHLLPDREPPGPSANDLAEYSERKTSALLDDLQAAVATMSTAYNGVAEVVAGMRVIEEDMDHLQRTIRRVSAIQSELSRRLS